MKFDVVVGNPPYIKNIHLQFLVMSCKLAPTVSLIHPGGWLFRVTSELGEQVKDVLRKRVKKITLFNGNAIFEEASFFCPLVITQVRGRHEGKIELHYDTTGNSYFIDRIDDAPSGLWEPTPEHLNLIDKYCKLPKSKTLATIAGKHRGRSFVAAPEVAGTAVSHDRTRFFGEIFATMFYRGTNLDELSNPRLLCFNIDTESEKKPLISFMKTKFARFGVSINKISQHVYLKRYLETVPVPPLDREWDDKSLCEFYKITDEEWKLIDQYIPDFDFTIVDKTS